MNVIFKLFGYELGRIEIDVTPAIDALNAVGPDGHKPGDRIVKRFSRKWTERMVS